MSEINLLQETLDEITCTDHTITDVIAVTKGSLAVTWENFTLIADEYYDNGYGSAEVDSDLKILFSDGTWLERWEYDGSEGWRYCKVPDISTKKFLHYFNPFI